VQLAAVKAARVKPFEEMKAELAAEVAKQKGAKKFSEVAEPFNNLAYEQSDSLKPLAERYKLKISETGWFSREQPTPDLGPLAHPKLLAALFSADSVQQKRNTDAVEVAPGVLVAARVMEHRAPTQRSLEEAKPMITARLTRREALALARKEGEAKLAELAKGGEAGLKWSAVKAVSRRDAQGVPPAALQKIMTADPAKLPAHVGADKGEQGYALYRVVKVSAEPLKPEESSALTDRLAQAAGAEQFDAYVAGLRAKAKIQVNQASLEKK
jgi:peptidyl-prolyl cis-trans isomerase D